MFDNTQSNTSDYVQIAYHFGSYHTSSTSHAFHLNIFTYFLWKN